MRSYPALVFILAALAAATGCDPAPATTDAGAATDARGRTDAGLPAGWTRCGDYECRTVDVPTDDVDPANGTIALPVLRIPARVPAERIGVLFALGFLDSGTATAGTVHTLLQIQLPEVLDRFDIIFYDRRGTSAATALNCIDGAWIDRYRATALDPMTSTDWMGVGGVGGVDDLWQDFADGCTANPAGYPLGTMSSDTAARDVDRIRAALGEDQINFVTFDYGALSGASYATQFGAARLRAGVFHAPPAPYGPTYLTLENYTQLAVVREAALEAFFSACDAGTATTCPFHGGEGAGQTALAYDVLMNGFVAAPRMAAGRRVGAWDLAATTNGIVTSTGGETSEIVRRLAPILAAVEAGGDGAELLTAGDSFWWYDGTYDLLLNNAFLGIFLADAVCPPPSDLAAVRAAWLDVQALSPHFGPLLFNNALSCLHWPTPRTTNAVVGPAAATGSLDLLVIGGAHDLNQAPDGAVTMHRTLGVPADHFILWEGYGPNPALSNCVSDAIGAFLLDPTATSSPPFGGTCARGT